MKRTLLLVLTIALISCGGAEAPAEESATTSDSSATATSDGFVDNVTRAQGKARAIAAEEGERVEDVDEAMKDQ